MRLIDITPAALRKVSEEEVTNLHFRLHQQYGRHFAGNTRESVDGLTREDVLNWHALVVAEMERRGLEHESPIEKAALDYGSLPDEIMVTPDAVCIVGSTAARDDGGDVDVLFRFELDKDDARHFKLRRENIDLPVRKALGIPKEDFHPLDNPQGPHAESIPLYDLVLRRKKRAISKAVVSPGRRYNVMKPSMAGTTNFFSTDELWEGWAAEKIKQGYPLLGSPKIDGFRAVLGWNGSALTVWFEDSKESRKFPAVEALLRGKPPFVVEGEYTAKVGDRWTARTQLMAAAGGKLEAKPHFWLYDLLFAGEDVHDEPFSERLTRLRGLRLPGEFFSVLVQKRVASKSSLARVGKWAASAPLSEGLFLRRADAPYQFGSTDTAAKWKTVFELKVRVLEAIRRANGWTYRCGLRDGGEYKNTFELNGKKFVDLGNTFVTQTKVGTPGDTLNVRIEELLILSDGRLAWGKPTVVGVDRSRPAYTAAQAVSLARRGRVLKREVSKAEEDAGDEEGGTRATNATKFWEEHWHEMLPRSGRGHFVYQHHWRGLDDETVKLGDAELLQRGGSVHGDLRLQGRGALWGWTVFLGTAGANRRAGGDRLVSLPPDDKLQVHPKLAQPVAWLRVGVRSPYISKPGGAGATSEKSAKFFAVGRGTYRLGVCREHSFEVFLEGAKLKGRYIVQYAPVAGGRRVWLITKPASQEPYAETHDRDKVVAELKQKGQKHLVWSDGKGRPEFVDVARASVEKGESFYIAISKALNDVLVFPIGRFTRDGREREFTPADAAEMVRNFDANVLERDVPVNREHERGRGRVGKIARLWAADDGVHGELDVDEAAKKFRYVSPELPGGGEWTHPYTGQVYRNVLMGLALTNYPFFLGRMSIWADGAWEEYAEGDVVMLDAGRQPFVHEVPLVHLDEAQRVAYGVVLQPGVPDAQGHMMSAAEIEAACHRYMERAQALDEHHARDVAADEAKVIECWIQREPVAWRYGERETEVLPGSWCMGVKFYADELWQQVVDGEIASFSPKGWGRLSPVAPEQP